MQLWGQYKEVKGFKQILWIIALASSLKMNAFAVESSQVAKSRSEFEFLFQSQNNLSAFEQTFQKMEAIRQSAESSLLQLLKQKPNDLELQLRFAELTLQRGRDLERYALELAFANQNEKASKVKAQFKEESKKGLALHEKLLRVNTRHPLASDIYLGMARTRLSLGDKLSALRDATSGIERFQSNPNKTLLNLWIVRGDSNFALSRPQDALNSYEKARELAGVTGMDAAYIVYKMAWAHFNLKNPPKAIALLDELLKAEQDKLSLKKEAVSDYALFLVDLEESQLKDKGGIAGIHSYLAKATDASFATKAFESLGKNYFKNGHRNLALETYNYLLSLKPLDPANIDRALLIVNWSQSLANKWELSEKYRWLLQGFGPKSDWYKAQVQKPDVQKRSYDQIESSLRKFSMGLHEEATKESQAELRDRREGIVAQLYDDYLASFSEEPRVYYYRAEIFRRKKSWDKAGEHYDRFLSLFKSIPDQQKNKSDEKLNLEAALGSVQVWAAAIEQNAQFVPQMLKSCDQFIESFPEHSLAPQVALDAAKVELKQKRSTLALRRIEALIEKFPKTEQATLGIHAALDILNQEEDYVNLALKARMFLENLQRHASGSQIEKLKKDLNEILSKTEAKACESLAKKKGAEVEAALCFESFAKGFKEHELAPKALLLASQMNRDLSKHDASLKNLELLVQNYPNSELALSALSSLAIAYEKNFDFEKAAETLGALLKRKDRIEAREKIALRFLLLLEGLGQDQRLVKMLTEENVEASTKKQFFERRSFRILSRLENEILDNKVQKGKFLNLQSEADWKDLLASQNLLSLEAQLRLARVQGVLLRSENKLDKADQIWMAGLKDYWKSSQKRDPRILEAAARLRLEQASIWEIAFYNTDFTKSGARKTELFQKLENWYADVVSMKSPAVALEALMRSAQLAKNFSVDLSDRVERAPASDKEALRQVSEDLKIKHETLVAQVQERARAWKVISPALLSSLSDKSVAFTKASNSIESPWGNLVLWMDLNDEQLAWKEWSMAEKTLLAQMKDQEARSSSRRASFVLMAREGSLSNPMLNSWASLHTDKAGVQARIQALVNDKKYRLAQIHIDQYVELFGPDSFVSYASGLLAWSENNFEEAYRFWMNTQKGDDFRLAFLRSAWSQYLEGVGPSADRMKSLSSLAKNNWQKHMLAKVCFQFEESCKEGKVWVSSLAEEAEAPFAKDFALSSFSYRKNAYRLSIESGVKHATTLEDLEDQYAKLAAFYKLRENATEKTSKEIQTEFESLKKLVEAKSFQIRQGRSVAELSAKVGEK